MTDSKREDLLVHITSIIDSATTAGVYRSRTEALARNELPAVVIEPVSDQADYNDLAYINWTLQFRAAVITRGVIPDRLADPINQAVFTAIMTDRSLGGRAMDVFPSGTNFQALDGDQPTGVSDNVFTVRYRTSSSDLTV
jgi:hypothetical protein